MSPRCSHPLTAIARHPHGPGSTPVPSASPRLRIRRRHFAARQVHACARLCHDGDRRAAVLLRVRGLDHEVRHHGAPARGHVQRHIVRARRPLRLRACDVLPARAVEPAEEMRVHAQRDGLAERLRRIRARVDPPALRDVDRSLQRRHRVRVALAALGVVALHRHEHAAPVIDRVASLVRDARRVRRRASGAPACAACAVEGQRIPADDRTATSTRTDQEQRARNAERIDSAPQNAPFTSKQCENGCPPRAALRAAPPAKSVLAPRALARSTARGRGAQARRPLEAAPRAREVFARVALGLSESIVSRNKEINARTNTSVRRRESPPASFAKSRPPYCCNRHSLGEPAKKARAIRTRGASRPSRDDRRRRRHRPRRRRLPRRG